MNLISLLVANISGTIVQSNQTHLVVNTGTDLVTTIVNIVTAIGIGIALVVSIYTLRKGIEDGKELRRFQDETIRTQKDLAETQNMQSKFQRLAEVYKLTNTTELREARKNIFDAYRIYREKHYSEGKNKDGKTYTAVNLEELKGKKFEDIYSDGSTLVTLVNEKGIHKRNRLQQDIELVRATLDNVGTLLNEDLIPEEALLQEMWGVVIYCWDALKDQINIERDKRQTMYYMANFESFYKRIEEYIIEKKLKRVTLY